MAQDLPITWHITFDPDAERGMDSLGGCWQIGAPDKDVFNAALTAPHALVTDTLLPYPVGGTSYAEFSVPVYFFGEGISMTFSHRLEMDPGEAVGWVEFFDAGLANDWVKADPWMSWTSGILEWTGDGIDTDTAVVFTGTNNGWGNVGLYWQCIGVFQGPHERDELPDSMRFRFAFQALANTNDRDGWMIDDLVVTNNGCFGSVAESSRTTLTVSPNPAADRVTLELGHAPVGPLMVELIRADGALLKRDTIRGVRHTIDLADAPDGPYLLRVVAAEGDVVERLVVQR